jgi:Ca2+-binding RTX toxin-like protein
LGTGDVLVGGGGTDTLSAAINATGTYAPSLSTIETVSTTFTGAGTLSLLNSTGITSLEAANSTQLATFTNIASLTGLTLKVTDTGLGASFGFATSAVSGTTDSVALNLSGVTAGTITVEGVETINIASGTAASALTGLTATSATTLNITGAQSLSLGALSTSVRTIDGTNFTGAALTATGTNTTSNTITGGSGNDVLAGAAGNDVISGGAGNDTITSAAGNDNLSGGAGEDTFTMVATLTAADTVAGGNDTDTLSITAPAATGDAIGVTSIETLLDAVDGANDTHDLAFYTATTLTRVNTSETLADSAFTNASASVATLGISGVAPGTVSLARATDTTTNSLAVAFTGAGSGLTAALTLNNEETISIASGGTAANTVADFNATDLVTLTITGAQNLTLTGE